LPLFIDWYRYEFHITGIITLHTRHTDLIDHLIASDIDRERNIWQFVVARNG